ncbi:MAG: hypothetical protein KBS70_03425 [Bacteroidales bacterium]|nr:hypothetical protein [Candidatus Colicola equi]
MKVRFELNIDEIINCSIFPCNDDAVFLGEQAKDKTFLFVDKLSGDMQAVVCITPASENNRFACTNTLFIPKNAVIIDDEEKEVDSKHESLMLHIQDCCDKVCNTVQSFDAHNAERYNLAMEGLKGVSDQIAEGISSGSGISEKTLLSALNIVTDNRKA